MCQAWRSGYFELGIDRIFQLGERISKRHYWFLQNSYNQTRV